MSVYLCVSVQVSESESEREERKKEREWSFNCHLYRKPSLIPDDNFSKDIFGGEDGLAEFNEVLRQLEDIQFSIDTGSFLNSL